MRTRLFLIVIALFAIMPFHNVMAQDIEGVDIHQKMTKSQIVEKFGQPTSYETYESDDGTLEEIFYHGQDANEIYFTGGKLSGFSIDDDSFVIAAD